MSSTPPDPGPLWGRFWRRFLRPHAARLAALAPLLLLAAATSGGYVLITKFAGDQIQKGEATLVYQVPAWILGVAALRAAALYGQAVMTSGIALRTLSDVQQAMFEALLQADYARVRREPTGALAARFTSDMSVLSEGLVRSISQLARDALTLLAALGAMIYIDWVLALMVLGVFALAASPLQRIAKRARKDSHAAQAQIGDLAAFLSESFTGAQTVRAFGLERYEGGRARDGFERRRKLMMRLVRNRARADPLLELLGAAAAAGVFALVGWRITQGAATVGDVLAFIATIATASAAARGLGTYGAAMNESAAALERVFALLDEAPKVTSPAGAPALQVSRGGLAFEGVRFEYNAGAPILDGVDLVVEPGMTVALVGPSGAGKSTLLNLVPRLYDPSAGRVMIDGQDIRGVEIASLRRAMAVVSQDVTLFNDTVRANVGFGREGASEAEIRAALEAAAAAEFVAALPGGLDYRVGEFGGQLSGGQRQRLALARAFLRDAPILLLDEATSALDAESERQVQEALARLARGRTTLVIAHRLATVRRADLIAVMEAGRIVETGKHDELLAKGGLYARLARLQFADAA